MFIQETSCTHGEVLSRLSCHGRKHSQTIFTIEIPIKILAASTWMIDFFCKSMAASNFCDERKSALTESPVAKIHQPNNKT